MAKYIEREATIKELLAVYEREFPTASGAFDEFATKILPNVITFIPAADVAPVQRGRWEKDRDFIKCSACGYGMYPNYCRFMDGACVGTGYNEPNYCPNCGAKMEGDING